MDRASRRGCAGWGLSLVLALGVACGGKSDAPASVLQIVEGGPSVPELKFRELIEPIEALPIALTASDGSGLQLVALEARTVIEDPLAFTELHLTFRNPEPRRREGRFEITLPPQAAVSRFAMRVGDGFQEGEVVELARARQVYEDFLHRKQDPALLEKDDNRFSARVFPIEANADKEIILAYSEERPLRSEPYRLLIGGLPALERFDVDVRLGSSSATGLESTARARGEQGRLSLHETNHVPKSDLEVHLPRTQAFALRSGELVVARVAPAPKLGDEPIQGLTILFDTSASRALGFSAQIERTARLLVALEQAEKRPFDVRIVAFDQDVEEIYRGPASGFALREKSKLLARDALGASDLGQALAYLAERPEGHERLLVVGDGVVTAGADDLTSLREAVAKLAAHGVRRLDVIAEGGVRDDDTLAALTRAGLASTGVWLDARMTESTWVEKLRRRVADEVSVNLAGATWIEPRAFEAVQVGDERLVFAELPPGTPVQIELGDGSAVALPVLEAPRPLLERAMARAKIAAFTRELNTLRERDEAKRAALQSRIVALSVKQRVLSELTGLLVLETDADYRRFGIAQTALTDILHVGDEGLALMHRAPPLPTRVLERADAEESLDDAVGMVQEGAAPEAPSVARGEAPSGPAQDRASKMPSASAIAQAKKPALRARHATSPSSQAPVSKSAPAPRAAPRAPEPAASGIAMGESPALSSRKGSAAVDAADGLGSGAVVTERRSSGMLIAAQPTWTASVRVRSASGVGSASAQRVLSGRLRSEALRCYSRARAEETDALLRLELGVDARGRVVSVDVPRALSDAAATRCVSEAARRVQLEKPEGGSASLLVEIVFRPSVTPPPDQVDSRPVSPRPRPRPVVARREPALEDAYEGVLAEVLSALRSGDGARALEIAERAHRDDPADVIALVALGEALEARGDRGRAARVYGSLIDLFPARADLRRMAGARLERLGDAGVKLAVDSYRRALAQRPDHPSSHRLHAFSLLAQGRASEAFAALETALGTPFNEERFPGVSRLLREDLGLAGAAWLRLSPQAKERIEQALSQHGAELPTKPSLRFVLSWETDANDVDFHIYDGRGGHASYMNKRLGSGGELFADITTGYGPECFAIAGAPRAFPYTLEAHYFARGPMGYGMGKLQIVQHDGKGALAFAEHPFVIMKDKAFIRLARLDKSLL